MKDFSSFKNPPHYPVMLDEVIKLCSPEKGGHFIDCTFGSGGYTNAILSFSDTRVISLDRDKHVLNYASETKEKYKERFTFHNNKFSDLDKVIKKDFKADFIIFDLGISSLQIFNLARGFSFNAEGKIDMRMGLNSVSAEDVLNKCDLITLKNILRYFGDEKDSSRIANNIVKERKKSPILSIPKLVEIIEKSKKKNFKKKINICTKTFQAIRIFVNKEVSELVNGLITATRFLKRGGKLIVVSFHSLEDKIVKFYFTNYSQNKSGGSRYYPQIKNNKILFENYKNKIITPKEHEIKENAPSRSAKLRYAIRSRDNYFYPEELKKNFLHYLKLESEHV
tara:strand:+ start:1881 stop:2894 length:1014 start_codon:yes stop_codon:yes gene_type:complete